MSNRITNNKILHNASWIVGARVAQSLVSFFVSILTARYLGPSQYGLVSYAASLVAFVIPVMKLGLPSITVQALVNNPEQEGEILGTSMVLNFISSLFCVLGVVAYACVANQGDKLAVAVCALYSVSLVCRAFEITLQWYHAHYLSKYSSIIIMVASLCISAYRVFLLVTGKSVLWFAVVSSIDLAIISVLLAIYYKKLGGRPIKFSKKLVNPLLSKGKFYVLSGILGVIFTQTDRIMIKELMGTDEVGYYSVALTLAGMAQFVYEAIIESFRPSVFQARKVSLESFESQTVKLYAVTVFLSLIQSLLMTLFAPIIVPLMYGEAYQKAVPALQIAVWFTAFSYFGGAEDVWLQATNNQKYIVVMRFVAAAANVVLNMLMIPKFGICGAAVATVVTQFLANVGICFAITPLKENMRLLGKALNIKNLFRFVKDTVKTSR